MYLTHIQYLKLKFICTAASYNRAVLETLYQDGVKLLHPETHIVSAREYDTQHIALVGSDKPICGAKIKLAHDVPLQLGYLCDKCNRKQSASDDYLADMIFSGQSLDITLKRMGATVEAEDDQKI